MGKIVYLMGKSSTGKDTIYKRLLENNEMGLKTIVPYTTRPIRIKETDGVEYHFTDESGYQEMEAAGKIIEQRAYHTYHGIWRYFTADDGQIDLTNGDYIIIGTLESYVSTVKFFGQENLVPVLTEVDDGARLQRALNRERKQEEPKYEELCRRFLADSEDFSEEKIKQAGIDKERFCNEDLDKCLEQVREFIRSRLTK